MGFAGLWLGAPKLLPEAALAFTPLPETPGFRSLAGGEVSARPDPFAGLDTAPDTGLPAPSPVDDPCTLLPTNSGKRVAVTLFTDIFCPICRMFDPLLEERNAGTIALTIRQLPLLGPASVTAARAILAADQQGKGPALKARLQRSRFVPDHAYLTRISESLGLESNQLLRDMDSPEVTRQLADSLGLAYRFGLFATPGCIVGRTAVLGRLPPRTLNALITAESQLPSACPSLS